tara:strand:+ start:705 stop:1022 length:318 start_codon:yes stop_codon:yes gene_type:complete
MAKNKKFKEDRETEEPTPKVEFSLYRQKKLKAPTKPKREMSLEDIEDNKYEFGPNVSIEKLDEEKGTSKGVRLGKDRAEIYYTKKFKTGGLVKQGKPKIAKKGWR